MNPYMRKSVLVGVLALALAGCQAVTDENLGTTMTTTSGGGVLDASTTVTTTSSEFGSSGFSGGSIQNASFAQSFTASSSGLCLAGHGRRRLPPNPLPGECYARIALAAVSQTVEEQIMVEPARQEVRHPRAVRDGGRSDRPRRTTELVSVRDLYHRAGRNRRPPGCAPPDPHRPGHDTVIEEGWSPERTVWKLAPARSRRSTK